MKKELGGNNFARDDDMNAVAHFLRDQNGTAGLSVLIQEGDYVEKLLHFII